MSRLWVPIVAIASAAVWYSVHSVEAQPPGEASQRSDSSASEDSSSRSSDAIVAERGTVRLDQEAELATDQPGTLDSIGATEGERVEKGQVIAELRSLVAEAALAVAAKQAGSDIDIRYAQAAEQVAQKELEKSLKANERSTQFAQNVPELEIERLRLAQRRAELQIEKAKLEMEVAELTRDQKQAELDRHTIRSPLDGVVIEVLKQPGEAVQQGDPILHVVKTDVVRVEGYISIVDAARVRPGDPVTARIDDEALELPQGLPQELAEETFDGEVMFVDPTVGSISGDIRVWARVENPENLLKAGLPATMTIRPTGKLPSVAGNQGENR